MVAMGIYIAKRTERGGVLVAFEGERMTEEEAAARGLLDERKAVKDAPAKRARKAGKQS